MKLPDYHLYLTDDEWHNIDFENETIWIRETLQQSTKEISGQSNYTSETKTESSNRTLPMIPKVKQLLLEQKERQERNREFLKTGYIESDYVCTFDNGKELTPNYLTKKFHLLIKKQNEFPQIRFHDLRHPYVKLKTKKYCNFLSKKPTFRITLSSAFVL